MYASIQQQFEKTGFLEFGLTLSWGVLHLSAFGLGNFSIEARKSEAAVLS
jgi:hypothetical protein